MKYETRRMKHDTRGTKHDARSMMRFFMLHASCFLFLASCLLLFSACGGDKAVSPVSRTVDLSVDWSVDNASPALSKYTDLITVKGAIFTEAEEQFTDSTDGKYSDGKYSFNFSEIPVGNYLLFVEFYYAGEMIGTATISVSFDDSTGEKAVSITSGDISLSGEDSSVSSAVANIAPQEDSDLDGDGLKDKTEKEIGTDPLKPDTDGDGVPDGIEVGQKTDPLKIDTDSDGTNDKEDAFPLDPAEWADTDKDKIGDNKDNCINAANTDQQDSDSNGKGDACSNDDDGDGLNDEIETGIGTDPKKPDTDGDGVPDGVEINQGTNPLLTDTDTDGTNDKDDVFPLDSTESADTDKDTVGDNKDNCKLIANSEQTNTDLEYFTAGIKTPSGGDVANDFAGDACDDDIDGDGLSAVYVYTAGADTNLGTFYSPVKTIEAAINLAKSRGEKEVRVSAGTYSLANVKFADGISILGGYKAGYSSRKVHSDQADYKTALVNVGKPVTLHIEDFTGSFALDGFYIINDGADDGVGGNLPDTDDYGCGQATVYIVNSDVELLNNVITVSGKSSNPCGALLGTGAKVMLDANKIDATGSAKAKSSAGLSIVEAPAIVTNNIIVAGSGEHSSGIRINNASPDIINNTINGYSSASNPKTSYGIVFDGGAPFIADNIVFTGAAKDQSALVCAGSSASGTAVWNNLLTTFPQAGTNAVLIDCDGNFTLTTDFIAGQEMTLDEAVVSGNIGFAGSLSGLLDANYNLAGSVGVDAGIDSDVTGDYNGKPRPSGAAFDIGAIEK